MNVREAIFTRRSVRQYADTPVTREIIEQLLQAAVQAPSATNAQTWAFGVIQDADRLRAYSDRAKALLLAQMERMPMLQRYQDMLANPNFNIFYQAPALVVIYGAPTGPQPEINCTLAAENLMLAAHEMGLGACWIGFAAFLLNQPEVKEELGVPADYTAVAPLIVGYPAHAMPPVEKHAPVILFWR